MGANFGPVLEFPPDCEAMPLAESPEAAAGASSAESLGCSITGDTRALFSGPASRLCSAASLIERWDAISRHVVTKLM